jgi:hypothetical protein
MFCNFYLVKNHNIANNSTNTKAREKISPAIESLEFYDTCLTQFKHDQILIKSATYFYLQLSYLLGERSSLAKIPVALLG